MPSKPLTKPDKPKDNKQILLDLISQQYGPRNAMVMEEAFKNESNQVKEAMTTHGMTANDIGKSLGMDMDKVNELIKTQIGGGNVEQQTTPSMQYTQKPASSPLGFGGATMQNGQVTEQQPGILAGLLSTLVTGSPKTAANMDLKRLLQASEIQKNQQGKQVYGFDPSTGKVTLQANVPENADIRNMTAQTDLSSLPQEQQLAAYALARKIGGVRGAEKVLPAVVNGLKEGKNIDTLEDEIRYSQQSIGITGEWRNAVQNIMGSDKSESQRNVVFDALDDYQQQGDNEGAKNYLKRIAIQSGTADQQNLMMGKERTLDFLDEIGNDLDTLEKNGINTGFLSGNYENMIARVGQVKSPEMRELATKIAVAVMQYRRSMTGVQFGMLENKEYKTLFPGINKVGKFNTATLSALKDTFRGDVDKYYRQTMGDKNYGKIFDNKTQGNKQYIKTGKNKQGQRVGMLPDGTIEVISGQ